MAVCFPSLTELEILNDDKEGDQGYIATRPITFSKLQSLTIFVTSSIPLPFHKLELPSLLYFTLSSQCDYERIHRVNEFMDGFLQAVGQTLVGMAVDTPNSPNGYSHIYNHTLLKLPALQIWGCRIDGRSVQEASFLAGLHNLSHLIMFIPYVSHIISADHIYAHVKPFTSRSAFPQLDKVTLVFFDTSHQFPLDFSIRVIAAAQTLFPHLVVKGRNAACSTLAVLPP
ncbi:hypothetical protein FRC19_003794 [Serendipita sp. 401]|nr:hypothetical protein FRC19_003794 [Serendipita sp. 401]